jgi:DNA-binding HxlR family transcriptional regulator
MRSYGHYCGLAKALDVVGDRWSLLIIRELLLVDAARYSDLQRGLPGIATNLLATRLRELEAGGVVARHDAPPPIGTTVFRLTARGKALEPAILALGAWAAPLLGECTERDEVRAHWLALPLQSYLIDTQPTHRPSTIEIHTGDGSITMEIANGVVRGRSMPWTGTDPVSDPDLVLSGAPHLIMGLLMRRLSLGAARARGLSARGNTHVLKRLAVRPST